MAGFDKEVVGREWSLVGSIELEVVRKTINSLNEAIDELDKAVKEHAEAMRGYGCMTSINGVGEPSGGELLAQIGDILSSALPVNGMRGFSTDSSRCRRTSRCIATDGCHALAMIELMTRSQSTIRNTVMPRPAR